MFVFTFTKRVDMKQIYIIPQMYCITVYAM